jgi:hypothetical protein
MKFSFRVLVLVVLTSLVVISCKKEDDNINDDINPNNNNNDNVETVFGCMVDTACNYNSLANVDNQSCDYSCYGCTDELAFNFDDEATIDDGSCVYANQIMIDTWNVDSECDGLVLGAIIPSEITLEEGDNEGDIFIDFGIFTLNATINSQGIISIPSQDVSLMDFSLVTVNGSGVLQNEETAIVTITASALLVLNETCTLTFSL